MPTTSLPSPAIRSPPVPRHVAAVRLIASALLLAATLGGFTGCAAVALSGPLAPAVVLGAVVLGPLIVAESLSQSEKEKSQKKWEDEIESELRPLLPLAEAATSPAPYQLRVTVNAINTNYPKNIWVEAAGDFNPETGKRFAEGVRLLAWKRADDVRLRLYTKRERPAGGSVKDSVVPGDYSAPGAILTGTTLKLIEGPGNLLRGRRELAQYVYKPRAEVVEKLHPLVPRTATRVWRGTVGLEKGPRIVAWGDFSESTARALIDTSKSFFPGIAVVVYRDNTRNSKDWLLIARYDPEKTGHPVR